MVFLLEEDAALKTMLTGMVVSDDRRANRPVDVWFGQPDLELQARRYPYISIELIDINESRERVMNGMPYLSYVPDGYTFPAINQQLVADNYPTPYDLDYQVSVWSRQPRHDRSILAQLLSHRMPIRFGQVLLTTTARTARLDMLGGPRVADTIDENGKRLFRKVFTVRISTELFLQGDLTLAGLVQRIQFNETPAEIAGPLTPVTLTILSAGTYDISTYDNTTYQ